jgi:hypothetical protein
MTVSGLSLLSPIEVPLISCRTSARECELPACTLFLTEKSSPKLAGGTVLYRTTFRNSVPGHAGDSFDKTVCLAGSLSPSSPTMQSDANRRFLVSAK